MNPAVKNINCTLCKSETNLYYKNTRTYLECNNCKSVLMHPYFYISPEDEKLRYETHNNDVNDKGYQAFVMPIVREVNKNFPGGTKGLDFGAGTGPVISHLLTKMGYEVKLYDPYFWNIPENLNTKYNFIVCCEVIEHFHNPEKDFRLLRTLLKPGGSLFCMTDLITDETLFSKWYYKDDPTHVFFYHPETLKWINQNLGFKGLKIKNRLIEFSG